MAEHQQLPRLKPPPPLEQQQQGGFMKLLGRVSRQRWLTVGAIVFFGGAGLLLADSAAEVLVGGLQHDDDEDPAAEDWRDTAVPATTRHGPGPQTVPERVDWQPSLEELTAGFGWFPLRQQRTPDMCLGRV